MPAGLDSPLRTLHAHRFATVCKTMAKRRMSEALLQAFQQARFGGRVFRRLREELLLRERAPAHERLLEQIWFAALSDAILRADDLIRETRKRWYAGEITDDEALVILRELPLMFETLTGRWQPKSTNNA